MCYDFVFEFSKIVGFFPGQVSNSLCKSVQGCIAGLEYVLVIHFMC